MKMTMGMVMLAVMENDVYQLAGDLTLEFAR
jgi:hypothetical protein